MTTPGYMDLSQLSVEEIAAGRQCFGAGMVVTAEIETGRRTVDQLSSCRH